MPKVYKLDKTLTIGTTYTMEEDRYLVIEKIGTDVAGDVTIKVDGAPVATINGNVMGLTRGPVSDTELYDLKDYMIIVPPQRKIAAESSSSGVVRVVGKLVVLEPGESIPAEHMARYNAQFDRMVKVYTATKALNTDESIAAGQEVTITEITPAAIEDYVFDDVVGIEVQNLASALAAGQIGVKFELDGKPLDFVLASTGPLGVDAYVMPYSPASASSGTAFSLKDNPIMVPGNHTLTIKAVNNSGSAIAPATGTALTFNLIAVYKYIRKA